jgi:hypothetical protein
MIYTEFTPKSQTYFHQKQFREWSKKRNKASSSVNKGNVAHQINSQRVMILLPCNNSHLLTSLNPAPASIQLPLLRNHED